MGICKQWHKELGKARFGDGLPESVCVRGGGRVTLPRTSPTKATYGVAIVYAGVGRHFQVSHGRPAPTKATPPRPLQARFTHPKQPIPSAHQIWGSSE